MAACRQGLAISILDSDDTEQADLRGGRSPWFATSSHPPRRDLSENLTCDTLIVGAGITGSLVAERLTRQGLDVIIVDRELPGRGSTAASTSMLLWEIDQPLRELSEVYGYICEAKPTNPDIPPGCGHITLAPRTGRKGGGGTICEQCKRPLSMVKLPSGQELAAWGAIKVAKDQVTVK